MKKDDLLKEMKGNPSLNKWDVLCSYRESEINALLKTQYKNSQYSQKISLVDEHTDEYGDPVTITVNLDLKAPVLQFDATNKNECILNMKIEKGSYKVDNPSRPTSEQILPENVLVLLAHVPLSAVMGTIKDGVLKNTKKFSASQIIAFDDNKSSAKIILDFSFVEGGDFDIQPIPGQEHLIKDIYILTASYKQTLLKKICDFFKTNLSEITYVIGHLSSTSIKGTRLTPKSFIFCGFHPTKDEGMLNIYIQTKESKRDPGNISPSFQPSDNTIPPIPEGYTASLIIAREVLENCYLIPQFQSSGWTPVKKGEKGEEGISFDLKKDVHIFIPGIKYRVIGVTETCNAFDANLTDYPLRVTFKNDGLHVEWSKGESIHWQQELVCGLDVVINRYDWNMTISCTYHDTLKRVKPSEKPFDFSFKLSTSDFKLDPPASYLTCLNNGIVFATSITNATTEKLSGLNITFDGLDILTLENLLLPDQNVIKLDTADGVHFPYDMIVFGSVTQGGTNIEKC
jgi:hypothetical protein